MKKRKLVTTLVLSLGVFFSISSTASATCVTLRTTDTSRVTAPIGLQNSCHYKAYNDKVSACAVYAIAQKANPGKGWVKAATSYMKPGTGDTGSAYQNNKINWRLELNPEGWNKAGCFANGSIW
ncbi:hypothetical protein Z968_09845 [Clostridium novyi A str. 4552]|uniref:Bacteriocin n=1 Tax=Clostridium novyi A str. 4552 TaxID=1444289 RepID=A0A0A0I1C1_CLONO|nr:hypothetical protein [Clostridium novyi]KGM95189.1 hypothetical protein Z968_09845 [Clostridium novyi A str. 4552]